MNIFSFLIKVLTDANTYIGIVLGGIGAIVYFKSTKSTLNFKKR